MESAIPKHLRVLRHYPAALPEGHHPPFPAWTARFPPLTGQVVMAYFGVQGAEVINPSALQEVINRFSLTDGPAHWDMASCTDEMGFHNLMAIAYWSSPEQFQNWKQSSLFSEWWASPERENGEYGFFLEVVSPESDRFETIFSDKGAPEGVACLGEGMSGQMIEHGYWGSARDRLPAAQQAQLEGSQKSQSRKSLGKRVVLSGRQNLCLIRSGQDWSDTREDERTKYITDVEPVLREGMHFLREQGHTVGCLSCRYMAVIDSATNGETEKTFGLAHFTDMAALELWAKSHPTHVAIFGEFMRYVKALNFNISLRLWHEIAVVPASAQHFEYINCHPKTGLLGQRCGESS